VGGEGKEEHTHTHRERERERERERKKRRKERTEKRKKTTKDGKCRMLVGKRWDKGKGDVGVRQNERASSVVRRSAGNF